MKRTTPDFGIYSVAFENGDRCHVEACDVKEAEVLACELAGQRATAHCEYLRNLPVEARKGDVPYAHYMPHSATQ
jgi:hypothetical protein